MPGTVGDKAVDLGLLVGTSLSQFAMNAVVQYWCVKKKHLAPCIYRYLYFMVAI